MRSLWEITEDFVTLDRMIEEQGGEISENAEIIEAEMRRLLGEKVDGCAEYAKSLDEHSDVIQKRIDELKVLQNRIDSKKEKFLNYVDICMRKINLDEAKGCFYRFSYRKSPPSILIVDENKIPAKYLIEKSEVSIDKRSILADMKNNQIIDGVEFAPEKKSLKMGLISTSKKKKEVDDE